MGVNCRLHAAYMYNRLSIKPIKPFKAVFGVTILGNNSAIPAFERHPTAQALAFDDQVFLIDCGEGTQVQLHRYKIRRSKINHIFISHLHGDHYFGLIGVITSMGLLGREQPLYIYGPPELETIVNLQLKAADTALRYPLHFVPNQEAGVVLSLPKIEVSCFPVRHRIPCWGYLFREKKPPRRIDAPKAIAAGVPYSFFPELQHGADYTSPNGTRIANDTVTLANPPGRAYAYCADTIFDESLAQVVQNVNLLYHETTYLADFADRAADRFHSTTEQAGRIAQLAGAQRLIIGHFSSKYEDLSPFLKEARQVFPHTELGVEGVTFRVLDAAPAGH